jgi:hypothetical protein
VDSTPRIYHVLYLLTQTMMIPLDNELADEAANVVTNEVPQKVHQEVRQEVTKETTTVAVFLDDSIMPVLEAPTPFEFDLDTRLLTDGEHVLKVVSRDTKGVEGVRWVRFTVRNGPAISIDGLSENAVVNGVLPMMINAYSKGDQRKFLIQGSETPRGVPAWLWVAMIGFGGWALYYTIMSL